MSERWRVAEEWRRNPFTGAPERFVIRSSADDATVICVEGPNCDEDAHHVAAAMNAMEGIPTETLESGVVVVPMEEYEALVGYAEELDEIESRMGNYSEQRAAIIRTANTRLQQNGGWWETGDQEPRRLREDCYEPGQQMGGGQG